MTSATRKGGRPSRLDGTADGRARLVEATCQHLRRRPPVDLPRKQLATAAGVAPGLVAYYFATDMELLEAAARPIIDGYLARLVTLVKAPTDRAATLRALVILLLQIARDDGLLLDAYIAMAKQHDAGASRAFLASAFEQLTVFLAGCEAEGLLKLRNSAFTQTVLWGICKTVAQQRELDAMLADGAEGADVAARKADLILDLLAPQWRGASPAPGATPPLRASTTSRRRPATD